MKSTINRRFWGVALAILLLGLIAETRGAHAQEANTTLRGFLRDSVTGDPVNGATVQLEGNDASATTDELGEFIVGPVPLGAYRMTLGKSGYHTRSFDLSITPQHPMEIDVGGMLLVPIILYHIEVGGRITNVNTGEAVAGATVTLDGRLQTQSGEDGSFDFTTDDFEAGTSELHVRMIGYEATSCIPPTSISMGC